MKTVGWYILSVAKWTKVIIIKEKKRKAGGVEIVNCEKSM